MGMGGAGATLLMAVSPSKALSGAAADPACLHAWSENLMKPAGSCENCASGGPASIRHLHSMKMTPGACTVPTTATSSCSKGRVAEETGNKSMRVQQSCASGALQLRAGGYMCW